MLTDNILELIGNTPLLQLKGERVFAKAEFLNPGGSIKDRVALAMLEAAQRGGKLKEGSIIVEPSSGNTGIGLALVGHLMGYRVRIVMPEGMSEERKKLIKALGGEPLKTRTFTCRSNSRTRKTPASIMSRPPVSSGSKWVEKLNASLPASAAVERSREWENSSRSTRKTLK